MRLPCKRETDMTKSSLFLAVVGVAALSVGAKAQSCSAEVDPGDGSAAGWAMGPEPTVSSKVSPMSCQWLQSDNCWKRLMTKALACSSTSDEGTFAADRHSCTYAKGNRWEFEGDVATPGPNETHFPLMNWRTLDEHGEPCLTSKGVGIGRTLIDVQGEAVLYESTGITTYRVTCEDGTTFSNNVNETAGAAGEGVCPEFAGEWLAHRAPGLLVYCKGDRKDCTLELWGGPSGLSNAATCGW